MAKTSISKHLYSLFFGACVMSALTSCGGNVKSGGGESSAASPVTPPQTKPIVPEIKEEIALVGRYEVKFESLNSHRGGNLAAEADLQVLGDQMVVRLDVKDSFPNTPHSQFIYSGTECPELLTHDTNGDGYIDPIEASAVIGEILIPLDSNIDGQELGHNEFQAADMFGKFNYKTEGTLSSLLADLHAPDLNRNDEIAKLKSSDKFKLEGKVMVVQGLIHTEYLEGSVLSHEGTSAYSSLIKACGKITRVIQN